MVNKSGDKNVDVQPANLKLVNVPWQNRVALDYVLVRGFSSNVWLLLQATYSESQYSTPFNLALIQTYQ